MRMAPDFSLCTDRHQELLAAMNRKQTAKIKSRGFNRVLTSDICLRYQSDQRDFNDQIDGAKFANYVKNASLKHSQILPQGAEELVCKTPQREAVRKSEKKSADFVFNTWPCRVLSK